MIAYYAIIILAFLLCIIDLVKYSYVRLAAFVAFGTILVLFVGLRSMGVDNDGPNYAEAFNFTTGTSWAALFSGSYIEGMERGYLLLNKLVFSLGGDIHGVFFLMAFLTGLINYTLIYKNSPRPFFSLLIYLCFFYFYRDFTQIRYALSAVMGIWALFLFIDRRYFYCFLVVFIAAFIHGAVLIIPLLICAYLLVKNYWFYFLLPLVGLVLGFLNPVMFLFQLGGLPPTLANYVQQDEFGKGGYMVSVIAQVFMVGVLVFKKKLLRFYSEKKIDLFFIALSLGSFINLTFISFAIMQRLASLLFGVVVFLIPYFFVMIETHSKDKYNGLFLRFIFMLFVLFYGLMMVDLELMRPYSIL